MEINIKHLGELYDVIDALGKEKMSMRNRWLEIAEVHARVYLRITNWRRFGDETSCATIEVATVEVEEEHRQQGNFTRLLDKIEEISKARTRKFVFVENVMYDYLRNHMEKRGYTRVGNVGEIPCCFWKKFST